MYSEPESKQQYTGNNLLKGFERLNIAIWTYFSFQGPER